MNRRKEARVATLALPAALFALGYAVWGAVDAVRTPLLGVMLSNQFEICRVFNGTAAQAAGLRVGDHLLSVNGEPVQKGILGRPLAHAGETREYRLERSGEQMRVSVTFGRPPLRAVYLRLGTSIVGLCFLLAGFYVLRRRRTPLGSSFFVLCLAMSIVLFYRPRVDLPLLKFLLEALEIAMWFTMAGAFVYFLFHFPRPKTLLERWPWLMKTLITVTAIAATLVITEAAIVILTDVPLPRSVFSALNLLSSAVILGYVLVGLVAFAHTYWKVRAKSAKRILRLVLAGTVLGILPVTVYSLVLTMSPYSVLPLEEYVVLSTVLVPLTAGYAVLRLSVPDAPAAAS